MSNSQTPFNTTNGKQNYSSTSVDVILLITITFSCSYIFDQFIPTSFLTLPLIISILFTTLITKWGIPKLKSLRFQQIIREEGPKGHQSKAGTPTMGGLLIIPTGLIVGNLATINTNNYDQIFAISLLTLSFTFIGFLDDWWSFSHKTNTGLSPKGKLLIQTIFGTLFLIWANSQTWINSKLYLFNNISIDLNIWIWPFALLVLLAESNATNLTDGLDGLASGCGAMVFTGLAMQLILRENYGGSELATFCISMAGSWLGFLIHNRSPAKVFMGDSGSLPMGAALFGIAILSNSLWPLLIMGGVFFVESLSVIIQVWVFKITKRFKGEGIRFFRMAPIHHHFELSGNNEIKVVRSFWYVNLFLIILGLVLRPSF